ncbi:MAG: twin-arginine translocase subunit TatC [Phycisphaerales bacterium]
MARSPHHKRTQDGRTMPFGDHLEELRRRLIWALVGLAPIFLLSMVFGRELLELLIAPVQEQLRAAGQPDKLQVTGPLESIGAWLRVGFAATIMVGLPWVVWQFWLFVAPGLHEHEKRFARIVMPMSAALTVLGIAFLYFVMLPAMLLFLIQFGAELSRPEVRTEPPPPGLVLPPGPPALDADPPNPDAGTWWYNRELHQFRYAIPKFDADGKPAGVEGIVGITALPETGIQQQYRISEYTSLVFFMGIAFAIGFQTPVVVLLAGWVGLVDRAFLAKNRKYAVFVCAVAAAVLTPSPDPFSMMVLAVPLYVLYEFGLVLLRVMPARRVAGGPATASAARKEPPDAGDL